MPLQPRLDWHGGQIDRAASLYPAAPSPWLDLSTGISPWAYPHDLAGCDWRSLPAQSALDGLIGAAADYFGVADQGEIAAVPGSDMAIRLLPQLLPQGKTVILGPAYSGYAKAWPAAIEGSLADAQDATLTILANPNNPDGRIVDLATLRGLGCGLLADEAFADAMPQVSLLPDRGGATVLRSFGKFFGLAGLRLGFVIADKPLITVLKQLLGDWPLSSGTLAIATRAYADRGWQDVQRSRLEEASVQLRALLGVHGLEEVGATPLFVLVRHPRAGGLFTHLCERGILVRPFAYRPDWLRFGIPGRAADWQRLKTALEQWSTLS